MSFFKKTKKITIFSKIFASFFVFILLVGVSINIFLQEYLHKLLLNFNIEQTVFEEITQSFERAGTLFTILFLLFSVIVSFFVAKRLVKSLTVLKKATEEVGEDNWPQRIEIDCNDETKDLAEAFNKMAEKIKRKNLAETHHSKELEEKVQKKTNEIKKVLESVQEDKKELEKQRLATLNILEDISESKQEIEATNEALAERSKEMAALKTFSEELVSAIDVREIIKIAANYFSDFFSFSVVSFLIFNPNDKSDLNYSSFSKEAVSEEFVEKTKKHLIEYIEKHKISDLREVGKLLGTIKPKHFGEEFDNKSESEPRMIEYFPLIIKNKHLGLVQISSRKKNKLNQEETGLIKAITLAFSFSIDRLQSLIKFQQMKTESLVESLSDGIVMFGVDREIELANPAFQKNIAKKENLLNLQEIYKLFPEVSLREKITLALNEGELSLLPEVAFERKFYEIFVTPVKDATKKIIGGAIIFHDITYLKEMDQLKTEFVSVASHQLRTPLTAIKLFTDMIHRGDVGELNKEQKDYISNVKKSTDRMVKLVNDLLNVTRIESGRLRIDAKPLDILSFIKSIVDEAKPLADAKQQKIKFIPEKRAWPKISFDESLLRQVIHNLIMNALRYSPGDNGKVEVKVKKEDKEFFVISVKDNGIGIPAEAQKNIFEKFFRADNAIKAVTEGTGLGLYVSRMIVELSEGTVWFETEKNKGTTFFVKLPLKGVKSKEGNRGLAIS